MFAKYALNLANDMPNQKPKLIRDARFAFGLAALLFAGALTDMVNYVFGDGSVKATFVFYAPALLAWFFGAESVLAPVVIAIGKQVEYFVYGKNFD